MREKLLGLAHPETASSLISVGRVYERICDYPKALEYEKRALEVADAIFGSRSPIAATALDEMSAAYFGAKNFKRALEIAETCLAMRRELFGEVHPSMARSISNIAACHFELGRIHRGHQILDEYLRVLPKTSPNYEFLKGRKREFENRFARPGFRRRPRRG